MRCSWQRVLTWLSGTGSVWILAEKRLTAMQFRWRRQHNGQANPTFATASTMSRANSWTDFCLVWFFPALRTTSDWAARGGGLRVLARVVVSRNTFLFSNQISSAFRCTRRECISGENQRSCSLFREHVWWIIILEEDPSYSCQTLTARCSFIGTIDQTSTRTGIVHVYWLTASCKRKPEEENCVDWIAKSVERDAHIALARLRLACWILTFHFVQRNTTNLNHSPEGFETDPFCVVSWDELQNLRDTWVFKSLITVRTTHEVSCAPIYYA
jgi:hypothetical protein